MVLACILPCSPQQEGTWWNESWIVLHYICCEIKPNSTTKNFSFFSKFSFFFYLPPAGKYVIRWLPVFPSEVLCKDTRGISVLYLPHPVIHMPVSAFRYLLSFQQPIPALVPKKSAGHCYTKKGVPHQKTLSHNPDLFFFCIDVRRIHFSSLYIPSRKLLHRFPGIRSQHHLSDARKIYVARQDFSPGCRTLCLTALWALFFSFLFFIPASFQLSRTKYIFFFILVSFLKLWINETKLSSRIPTQMGKPFIHIKKVNQNQRTPFQCSPILIDYIINRYSSVYSHGVSPGVRSAVFLLYFFPSSFSLIFTHFSNKYSN